MEYVNCSQYNRDINLIFNRDIKDVIFENKENKNIRINGYFKHKNMDIEIPLTIEEYNSFLINKKINKTLIISDYEFFNKYNATYDGSVPSDLKLEGMRFFLLCFGSLLIIISLLMFDFESVGFFILIILSGLD